MSNYRTFQSVAVNAGCLSNEPKNLYYGLSFQLLQVFTGNVTVKMLVENNQSDSNLKTIIDLNISNTKIKTYLLVN